MIKNNLTQKQTNIVLIIIFFYTLIILFVAKLINGNINTTDEIIFFIVLSIISALFATLVGYFLLDYGRKQIENKYEQVTRNLLTKFKKLNTFYEIELVNSQSDDLYNIQNLILFNIIKEQNYKFYAELLENKIIHIICKDKNCNIIYNITIENYLCFNKNFKFVETK